MTDKPVRSKALPIGITVLLLLNAAVAWFLVSRARRAEKPLLECAQQKWGWVGVVERMETDLRHWEMYASRCLGAAVPLITRKENPPGYEVAIFDSARPIVADSEPPTALVPTDQMFRPGAWAWVCADGESYLAKIGASVQPGQKRTAIDLEFPGEKRPRSLTRGMIVAQFKPARYSLAQRRRGGGAMVTVSEEGQAPVPVAAGLTALEIDTDRGERLIRIRLGSEGCDLTRRIQLSPFHRAIDSGYWVLTGDALKFNPWPLTAEAVQP
ncbi:MAG: hypothetical protein V1495_06225 [Pseudomonadota bacterium]